MLEYKAIMSEGVNQYWSTLFKFLPHKDKINNKNKIHNIIMESQLGKPPTLFITAKLYLHIFCENQLVGCTNNQIFQLQLKDAPTPCLPTTNGRRIWPPIGLYPVLCTSQPPLYDHLISNFCSPMDISIRCIKTKA